MRRSLASTATHIPTRHHIVTRPVAPAPAASRPLGGTPGGLPGPALRAPIAWPVLEKLRAPI
jgi:hypothetical protein